MLVELADLVLNVGPASAADQLRVGGLPAAGRQHD